MKSPRTVKKVQSLAGRVVVLSCFISKSADRCNLLFKALKLRRKLQWTPKYEETFQQLKEYLTHLLILTKPKTGDTLIIYLVISKHTTSSVLVIKEEDGNRRPVYYISKNMVEAKKRYPLSKKLVLVLITYARKLRSYF